jgi:hypothetical protein
MAGKGTMLTMFQQMEEIEGNKRKITCKTRKKIICLFQHKKERKEERKKTKPLECYLVCFNTWQKGGNQCVAAARVI